MSKLKIRLPAPFHVQNRILTESNRFNAICMGEKGGKTTLGIEALLLSPRGAVHGKHSVAWFSASKSELTRVRRIIKKAADSFISRQVSPRQLELKNGNSVYLYSLDEPVAITESFGLIVVDDVRRVYGFLDMWEDTLSECLRVHKGQGWFLSDAYGKKNDFYKLFDQAIDEPDWAVWQFNSYVNPFLPAETAEEAESVSELEWQQRFGAEFLDVAIELTAAHRIIGPNETFLQWCQRLGRDGLKVDGRPFKLDDRPAMAWVYDQIPSTADEAFRYILVLMKCAQVGFTVAEMLAMIYLGLKFQPATVGMFLPDMNLAGLKSTERFLPIVRTIPDVHQLMTMDAADGSGRKAGEGNVRTRRMGDSMFVFSWTSGRATTESIPMDILSFDEVQEMTLEQMEKTRERLSASPIRFTLMGSTANWPDSDIDYWYKKGSRHQFHTECPHCLAKKPLDSYFPNCIKFDKEADRYRYVCASCNGWIDDPQRGEWIAENPDAEKRADPGVPKRDWPLRIRSIHFPQFLSPTISAGEIIDAYNSATDMKNFFNRKLGKPYSDPTQIPINLEIMNECARLGMELGLVWKRNASGTFMGIDQMGNFNVAIIKERLPDGRQAVVHLEYIYDADPFARCSILMAQYGVQCCVVETLPNFNDAHRFAQRHPGKVFLAGYGNMDGDMMIWGDSLKQSASDNRTDEEFQQKYTVRLDQYKCMQLSMKRFQTYTCLFPDPDGLAQEVLVKGVRVMQAICREQAFFHFTRTALVVEKDDEEKKYKRKVVKVGIDPHTSYANMLCDVAYARAHGTSTFILPQAENATKSTVGAMAGRLAGQTVQVMEQIEHLASDTCGSCLNYDPLTGSCSEIQATVRPADPGCWGYIARSS